MIPIAITDACIFIDLCEVELIAPFFALPIEVHTSVDVFGELYEEQQALLLPFQKSGHLTAHNITGTDRIAIQQVAYPRALSQMDKTVLHMAQKLNAMVLSSDGAMRKFAKGMLIECHGMLWILDRLLEESLLLPHVAEKKLKELITKNIIYRNNPVLTNEIEVRLRKWAMK